MIQNVRLLNGNVTRVDGYFYSFDQATDTMIQKTDDGTLAFAYPLDTSISREVIDMTYDGESWWTMEHLSATASDGFIIKRWVISNFVMVLQQSYSFASNATDDFEANAFSLEMYTGTVLAGGAENTDTITVSFDNSVDSNIFGLLTAGTTMFIGPSTKTSPTDFTGQSLRVTVSSTNPATKVVTLSADKTVGFNAGDTVVFSKNLWVFNQHYLKSQDAGALYKISIQQGTVLSRTSGGAYKDVDAATFVDLIEAGVTPSNPSGGVFDGSLSQFNKRSYIIFIRTNNLLFIDALDPQLITELSAIQNNLSPDSNTVYTVFDFALEKDTLFRLQQKFNIDGTESTESTYNYQLATFKPFPTAIALSSAPAILAADQISTSVITATVTDQYALPYLQTPAATIVFQTSGGGTGSGLSETGSISLDSNGQATVTYTAGDTAGLVTISAVVSI